MKPAVLLLALFTALTAVRAQAAVPVPPPAPLEEDLRFRVPVADPFGDRLFEVSVEPAPVRGHSSFFAQARPEEKRDRTSPRPPSEPRPPGGGGGFGAGGGRGEGFGSDGGGRSSFSSTVGSSQNRITRLDSPRSRAPRPVVVTSRPLDAKELAIVEEDLGIMARLLEKEIEREAGPDGLPNAMGITITRLDGRGPSVLLLEGYGAVFTFTVRMPLTPPPARASEKKAERPTDSPWERTRRELFGPPGGGPRREGDFGGGGDPYAGRFDSPEYDARKVEELKKSVLEALKQAGNIRALKADDYLTVVVQGASVGGHGPMEIAIETRTMTSSGAGGGPPRVETFVNRGEGGGAPRAGTLTVRARKSDAEEFAKGKLTAEQFAKKALVNLH